MGARDKEKYYWLKLKDTFFTDPGPVLLEASESGNGKEYVLIYLKLMCLATAHSGQLRYSDLIPFDTKKLAALTNTNPDIMRGALREMADLGLIEVIDDGTIYMHAVAELLGSETVAAERKREYRKSLKGDIVPLLSQECPQEIDIEIETEIDTDNRGHHPTVDEVKAYCDQRGSCIDPELFISYYASQGWKKKNGRPLTNWKAAVVTWEKKEKNYGLGRTSETGKKPAREFNIHYDND